MENLAVLFYLLRGGLNIKELYMLFLVVLPTAHNHVMTLTQTLNALAQDAATCKYYNDLLHLQIGGFIQLEYNKTTFVVVRIQ